MPDVAYLPLRLAHRSSVDLGIRRDLDSPAADAFLGIARQKFGTRSRVPRRPVFYFKSTSDTASERGSACVLCVTPRSGSGVRTNGDSPGRRG